jgi:lipopolysaccharide transport system permease protein
MSKRGSLSTRMVDFKSTPLKPLAFKARVVQLVKKVGAMSDDDARTYTLQGKAQGPIDLPESAEDQAVADSGWTAIIGPHKGALDWRLAELWDCRDLISLLVWRDFVALYKQTILGPAWHIIQPMLTTLTFTIIFGKIAALPTNESPPFLFYLTGNVLWGFFSSCLIKTSSTFVANANLMGKVYFHRMAIPISTVLSTFIAFGIQFVLFLAFWTFYLLSGTFVQPNIWMAAWPICAFMVAGYALGGGIIVSALTTRYRDLAMLVAFGVQLLMFFTPVIYSVSSVPEQYRWIVSLNPLSPIFEAYRSGFLGGGTVTVMQLAVSFAIMIVVLIVGLMLFSRVEKTFMDTI